MSRFTHAAATMHTLSLASMEEASRFGVRDADIDHLLLALTIDPGTGGQILRGMGAGLDTSRAAVAAQHAAQLELVGIASDTDGPGRIVFHETSGYEWTERALSVLKEATSGDRNGDSAAVLRTLIDEPSGLIDEILRRLDIDPTTLAARLDEVQQLRLSPPTAPETHALSGTRSLFVPASLEDVWALLSSAARIPEWDPAVAMIHADDGAIGPWDAESTLATPDGKPLRVKGEFRRQRVERSQCEKPSLVRWRFSYPDAVRSNPREVDFELEHAAGGMQIRATLTWDTTRRRRGLRVVRPLLKPLHRLLIFTQLAQIESGITRVFR
ncbi:MULTISPECIES: SRPBCC domain-containing protein [unclassified Microbacterium]|uniref:SRPBCC family protein n=1 Tax=unclassified Microbacterium TaxID=2609290 RepID=UPI000CFBE238|nr:MULTISPECIES: Clp protease N-terminal domain-containing protein [unclassified Microbacterium]PQZ57985.1 Clp protease [Microbacterium sp. MYb43]PQZ80799.1 Clp protease [Microbacterium sp. MYb40]PRB20272.1 Clp protease [Microbacterium sp. MYb54]PRB31943.1 Clp protease [Microbacterium sp. MYb50]PRB66467.1 Clp protease [Microbacterium sp. MYb24]